MRNIFICSLLAATFLCSCGDSGSPPPEKEDNFDRAAMLEKWADNSIRPQYDSLLLQLEHLVSSTQDFKSNPTEQNLNALRAVWVNNYVRWQWVSMYEIGKAEEVSLRAKCNTYPADATLIESLVIADNVNLDLPSNFPAQGLPAIEYLLYGLGESTEDILSVFNGEKGAEYSTYLLNLVARMESLVSEVLLDWDAGYKEVFIAADGNSATASVDRFVNDYLFYYEKFLRAGKVGIPAGVFSIGPLPENVECRYQGDLGKRLLQESLTSFRDFFMGQYETSDSRQLSLAGYLDELEVKRDGVLLSAVILDQMDEAFEKISVLDNNLKSQVEKNNTAMLELYDALQQNVVFLKVDMLQALNINVDFVDADGD